MSKIHIVVGYDGDYLFIPKSPVAFAHHANAEGRAKELSDIDSTSEYSVVTMTVADTELPPEKLPEPVVSPEQYRQAHPVEPCSDADWTAAIQRAWDAWARGNASDERVEVKHLNDRITVVTQWKPKT